MISLQRELPGQWLVEAGYTGSRGWNLTTGAAHKPGDRPQLHSGAVPVDEPSARSGGDRRARPSRPEPLRGLLPGTSLNGATIARSQLLRPYPAFGNIRTFGSDGTSRYTSAQFKVERRFARGYSLLAAYTWSRFTEQCSG